MNKTEYIVLKNGKPMDFKPRPIQGVIYLIQHLESHIDRSTQHSPYTIGKIEG